MVYKAKIEIGGYLPGEEVPEEKAIIWAKMYAESPVELVGRITEEKPIVDKEIKTDDSNDMFDDYLNRGQYVVRANLIADDFDVETLQDLLSLEKDNKNRRVVINAIKKQLE